MNLLSKIGRSQVELTDLTKMLSAKIGQRALSYSARRSKGIIFGGDGMNLLSKIGTQCLFKNPNGNIRYRVFKCQFTDYRISGNAMLAGTFIWAATSFWFNMCRDDMFYTKFHAFPGKQADNARKLGITPNL